MNLSLFIPIIFYGLTACQFNHKSSNETSGGTQENEAGVPLISPVHQKQLSLAPKNLGNANLDKYIEDNYLEIKQLWKTNQRTKALSTFAVSIHALKMMIL